MSVKQFLLVNSDESSWIVTYEPESEKRTLFTLYAWLRKSSPKMEGEAVGQWLEKNGNLIEYVYPVDEASATCDFSEDEMMEYTELLDDLRLFG